MYRGKSVSVVLMTYAERDSIRRVIEDFYATGVVDEVVVVNNNAQQGTYEEVAATPARQVIETRQGYGHATRRGLQEAKGDLVVLVEPDGTFSAADLLRMLPFSDQFDAVFGSRTFSQLIWPGANMGWFLRWGNRAVALMLSLLFRSARLSDVGCTYRLLSRKTVDAVLPKLRIGGSQLGPELLIRTILQGARHIEVPVNYLPRVGVSSVTGDLRKSIVLGLQMICLILYLRLTSLGGRAAREALRLPEVPASRLSERPLTFRTSDRWNPGTYL